MMVKLNAFGSVQCNINAIKMYRLIKVLFINFLDNQNLVANVLQMFIPLKSNKQLETVNRYSALGKFYKIFQF